MSLLIAALLLFGAGAGAQEEKTWDAQLGEVQGDVRVIYHDEEAAGVSAEKGMPLEAQDRIETGDDGRVEIGLAGDSVIELGPNSKFAVSALDKTESSFLLDAGSLVAKIRDLFKSGGGMRVQTATAVAAVRGTEFGVEATGAETHVGVFDEGRVSVQSADGTGQTEITRNQETSVFMGRAPENPRPLQRFAARRARIIALRRRVIALRRTWRHLPPAKRAQLRREFFERRRSLRREIREERRRRRDERRERRQERPNR